MSVVGAKLSDKALSYSGIETLLATKILTAPAAVIEAALSTALSPSGTYKRGRFECVIPFAGAAIAGGKLLFNTDATYANYVSTVSDNCTLYTATLGTGIRAFIYGNIGFHLREDGSYCPIAYGRSFTLGDSGAITDYDFVVTKDSGHLVTTLTHLTVDNNGDADLFPIGAMLRVWGIS